MDSITFGYVRVSSKEQNLDRQLLAMRAYGVLDEHVYMDKQSGKDFDRPSYKKLLRKMKPGDALVIKSIDRLGRNYEEILEQWRFLTKEKQIAIAVIDMPLLDTRQGRTLQERLSRTSYCSCSPMWHRLKGSSSASGRRRASRRPRLAASCLAVSQWSVRQNLRRCLQNGEQATSRQGERRPRWESHTGPSSNGPEGKLVEKNVKFCPQRKEPGKTYEQQYI